jgi:ABC-type polysaccharide/polyol phosphate export permease
MILNAGNLVMAMVFIVSSIFGMNLSDRHQESYVLFALVSMTWCSFLRLDTTIVLDFQG